jgi:uncharacterized protein YlxW (UPF0749 family)
MSDTSTETRPRSAKTAIAVLLVLAAVCLGGFFVWQNYGRPTDPPAGSEPTVQSQAPPRAEASDETKQALNALQQALNALQQTVKDLQASQQKMTDQLAAEQGERKMLSEQVGALAGRVDSLAAASAASVTPGASGNASAKKKR